MDQMVFNITLLKASRYCWEYFLTSRPSTQISLMAKDDDQLILKLEQIHLVLIKEQVYLEKIMEQTYSQNLD